MNLKEAGIDLGLAIAGLFGALLMSSKNEGQTFWQSTIAIIGGAASANYLTPLILKLARLENETQYGYATAFLLGFAGLRAIEHISLRFFDHGSSNSTKRGR